MRRGLREAVFINCWHANPGESAAMWRLYSRSKEAIAIRSTYQALELTLDDKVYLGQVNYIDFETATIPNTVISPFFYKRLSYEHEKEVRGVISPRNYGEFEEAGKRFDVGVRKHVELHMLIHAVYVAPETQSWYQELVKAVMKNTTSSHVPVFRSTIDGMPFL